MRQEIADRYGGSAERFDRHLSENGASMEDFRRFVAEEIAINAMLYQEAKTPAEQAQKQAKFLADLRAGATGEAADSPDAGRRVASGSSDAEPARLQPAAMRSS